MCTNFQLGGDTFCTGIKEVDRLCSGVSKCHCYGLEENKTTAETQRTKFWKLPRWMVARKMWWNIQMERASNFYMFSSQRTLTKNMYRLAVSQNDLIIKNTGKIKGGLFRFSI